MIKKVLTTFTKNTNFAASSLATPCVVSPRAQSAGPVITSPDAHRARRGLDAPRRGA